MIHVALSNDDSTGFRYSFLYWHMARETHRLATPEMHDCAAIAMECEVAFSELKYYQVAGRLQDLYRVP